MFDIHKDIQEPEASSVYAVTGDDNVETESYIGGHHIPTISKYLKVLEMGSKNTDVPAK